MNGPESLSHTARLRIVAVVYGRRWPKTAAAFVISNDSSCLMQIQGLLDRQGKKIRTLHLAQVLAPV